MKGHATRAIAKVAEVCTQRQQQTRRCCSVVTQAQRHGYPQNGAAAPVAVERSHTSGHGRGTASRGVRGRSTQAPSQRPRNPLTDSQFAARLFAEEVAMAEQRSEDLMLALSLGETAVAPVVAQRLGSFAEGGMTRDARAEQISVDFALAMALDETGVASATGQGQGLGSSAAGVATARAHQNPASESSGISRALIARLPRRTHLSGHSEECTICLDEYAQGNEIITLPCAHAYHASCITEWLCRSHECPSCKCDVKKAVCG